MIVPGSVFLPKQRIAGVDYDPYWDDVVLLMHMDGANGSNVFIDEKGGSTNAENGAVITTLHSAFPGGACADLTGDKLISTFQILLEDSAATVECFVYTVSLAEQAICGAFTLITAFGTKGSWSFNIRPQDALVFDYLDTSGTRRTISSGAGSASGLTLNAFHHIALSIDAAGDIRFFLDGEKIGITGSRTDSVQNPTVGFQVGATSGDIPLDGYIDDLRITKGVARYTADFTVPSAPFPNS